MPCTPFRVQGFVADSHLALQRSVRRSNVADGPCRASSRHARECSRSSLIPRSPNAHRDRAAWFNQGVFTLGLPMQEAAASSSSLTVSGVTAAIVSVVIFWLGQRFTRQAAQKERQRKVIEDWFRALTKWVDEYSSTSATPEYQYHALTSRQIIELSLPRKHRYLAWWMHEMAVAVLHRRKAASKDWASAGSCRRDLNALVRETGDHLLAWHHGELRSSDFHIPYKLRSEARKAKIGVTDYAATLSLGDFVSPVRMSWRRSLAFQRLLLDPEKGILIAGSLQFFLAKPYRRVASGHYQLQIQLLRLQRAWKAFQLGRLTRKAKKLERAREKATR
jgi:hypothetical protein